MARVVLNHKAIDELKRSHTPDLVRRGNAIRDAAGAEDHEVQLWEGPKWTRVTVRTATHRGRFREAKYRSLSHAIEAGRG